jgi:hypothetical protein
MEEHSALGSGSLIALGVVLSLFGAATGLGEGVLWPGVGGPLLLLGVSLLILGLWGRRGAGT